MKTACPSCGTEIDPARAPVARIRDGHVVTFCSTSCADGQAIVRPESTPIRAEETATSKAWYDKADEAVAKEAAKDVDELWDDDPPEVTPPIMLDRVKKRGYTWDESASETAAVTAEPEEARVTTEPVRSSKRLGKRHVLMIAGAILLGGMIIAIIEAVSPSTPSDAGATNDARSAAPAPVEPAPAEVAPEDAPIDKAKLAAAAVDELRKLMQSESPRIKRDASLALARTKDAEAIEVLLAGLDNEPSPHARVDIAYALARAGNPRGLAELDKGLSAKQRDIRLVSARALARLGNDSGRKALRSMLRIRTHKLEAAGVLAKLGDEQGLKLLRQTLAKDKLPDAKMRAAVYLGAAGQQEVRGTLHEILEAKDRAGVGAAAALAVLGDRSAIDTLTEQLTISAMRVEAALGLRRLGADVELEPLAVALVQSDEIGRVRAAEAILILTDDDMPAELE